ncbi:MAG: penicillin acylase family protein, partial [bacterium]
MRIFRAIVVLLLSLALFWALQGRIAPLPPLGAFLNPFSGYLQNGEDPQPPKTLTLPGLQGEVTVVWDDRRVPHIFAANDHDLYLAQGYLTARDRLWQMEIQVLAAAGRLAEVLGPSLVEHDRYQRRIGVPDAAAITAGAIEQAESTGPVVEAYTSGVNAYIAALDYADLPLEYKLVDYRPEFWAPLRSALLLKQMAWDLTTYNLSELNLTRARELLGEGDVDKLYPVHPPYTEPIIPPGTKWPFEGPQFSAGGSGASHGALGWSPPRQQALSDEDIALGSNNWAVSGNRTASGAPILCNDPHLSLTLPSVWYELQLHSPTVNVYGVTMPGAPGIVIGFNERIAWGLTNAETDVLDLIEIEFEDSSCTSYLHGEEWLPTRWRVDTIMVRDAEPVIDSTRLTEYGPVPSGLREESSSRRFPPGAALHWTGYGASQELVAFLQLNRASNYDDYVSALQHYDAPAQNFAFASSDGDIAIVHNGKIPIRREGEGRFVSSDGAEWFGDIPRQQLPQIKNPQRGFVSSANQYPVDTLYPYYLPGTHYSFERGARINEVLDTLNSATPEDMMILQTDLLNIQARLVLPSLLSLVDTDSFSPLERQLFDELADWDYRELAEMRT